MKDKTPMQNHQPIDFNIIFDLGCVLIDWNPDLVYKPYFDHDEKAMQRFYEETGIFLANKQMDKGKPFDEVLESLTIKYPHYEEPLLYWKIKWIDMIGGPVEGSVNILKTLNQKGYPLYGLTNWSSETLPLVIKQYDFFNHFKDIIVSGEVKHIKPEPEIYNILLNKHNLLPKKCLFIDDSLDNVKAAQELGIHTIHFKDPIQLAQEIENFLKL